MKFPLQNTSKIVRIELVTVKNHAFKARHRIWFSVFLSLVSLVLETRFFSKQVIFERSYLHCLKEFGDVHGHFEYVQEHIFRSAVFLSKFIRSKTPSDQENRCQVSNFHQNRVHHRKKTKIGWTFHPTLKLLKHRRETSYPPNISIFQGHRARSSG